MFIQICPAVLFAMCFLTTRGQCSTMFLTVCFNRNPMWPEPWHPITHVTEFMKKKTFLALCYLKYHSSDYPSTSSTYWVHVKHIPIYTWLYRDCITLQNFYICTAISCFITVHLCPEALNLWLVLFAFIPERTLCCVCMLFGTPNWFVCLYISVTFFNILF